MATMTRFVATLVSLLLSLALLEAQSPDVPPALVGVVSDTAGRPIVALRTDWGLHAGRSRGRRVLVAPDSRDRHGFPP